jgi:acetate---CoA ligase (ADP-forming)
MKKLSKNMNLHKLFHPESIAIIGASAETGKVGNSIAKNIFELGYAGQVFLVNAKKSEIFGRKSYASVSEIEQAVDLGIVAVPAKLVNEVILGAKDKIKNFVVISAGFAETDAEGQAREQAMQKIAKEHALNILGPNCLGFILPFAKLNASFGPGMPKTGNVCFISQSGALMVATADILQEKNLGFSGLISVGNKMQLDEENLLEYFGQDEKTKVIGMYLEGIKNGKSFLQKARLVSREKPIIVLKAGKTEKAQAAIASHTGALAGSAEIMHEALRSAGIIEAQNLEEFVNFLQFFSLFDFSSQKKIVAITNAGGAGVLTADAFFGKKINLAEIDEEIKKNLQKFLPAESSVQNPIDLLGDAGADRYAQALHEIGQQKNVGTILLLLTPQAQTPVEEIADLVADFSQKNKEAQVLAIFIGGARVAKANEKFKQKNILTLAFPEQAVLALEKYFLWDEKRQQEKISENILAKNKDRKAAAEKIIEKAKAEGRKALLFAEAAALMKAYQIQTVPAWTTAEKNEIVFPVVLKVDSDKVLHKTDQKGLVLHLRNHAQLEKEIAAMKKIFPEENLIVQPMLERGAELILGIKRDASFSSVIAYGLGGIYTEIFKMVNFLVAPQGEAEIKSALLESQIGFLFKETRGQKPYKADELAKVLWQIYLLAEEVPAIKEFDINPFLIYNDDSAGVAVDVKVII